MKFETIANILLPGRNFDGTLWKWYDYVGWLVTTLCIGAVTFTILQYYGV